MREFAHRPLGYLTVGGLAMILGLSTGVGIGYFYGGNTTPPEPLVSTDKAAVDPVIALADEKLLVKPVPVPAPLALPGMEDDGWTAIPDRKEKIAVATEAPAPWPELVRRIAEERQREQEKQTANIDFPAVASPVEDWSLAGMEDVWPEDETASEENSLYDTSSVAPPDQLAALPQPEQFDEQPGDRIDREAEVWEANSVTVPDPAGKPMISIVIDDLGLNRRNTVRAIRLPGPLTMAFLTYAEDLERQTGSAHAAGHELMVHFPMQPKNPEADTGPNALRLGLSEKELRRRLAWGLSRFKGYVGINNHMGSAFTGNAAGMAIVMDEMRQRGVLYLDSVTTQKSAGYLTAGQAGVPFIARDVFLDNEIDANSIDKRLAEVEQIARRQGHAIAIGHPHGATIEALARWLPKLEDAGFVLVPVSMIIKHRRGA